MRTAIRSESNPHRIPFRHAAAIACLTVAILLPFSGKGLHIDDPVYVWVAKHIEKSPLDFYGFSINWDDTQLPAHAANRNPPLVSYLIACFAQIVGWHESGLHLLFMIPAIAFALGTYRIAMRFTESPLWVSLLAAATPAFVVSSTTLMCDILMGAFYIWAIEYWMAGLDSGNRRKLVLATALTCLSGLSKYYGFTVVPLVVVYGILRRRTLGWWLLWTAIPLVVLAGYEWYTFRTYGVSLATDSASFALAFRGNQDSDILSSLIVGLSFVGGSILPVLFLAPVLWRHQALILQISVFILMIAVAGWTGRIQPQTFGGDGGIRWGYALQSSVFLLAGINILTIAAIDSIRRRDAGTILLFFWIAGAFFFSCFINWTVNVRTILPMVPAVSILAVRWLETTNPLSHLRTRVFLRLSVVTSLAISLAVAHADYALANSQRYAARILGQEYSGKGNNLWFAGHWGFQYYMEEEGGSPLDLRRQFPISGDILIVPANNTSSDPKQVRLAINMSERIGRFTASQGGLVATMSVPLGAGFYASACGPVPYVFGLVPSEYYTVYRIR